MTFLINKIFTILSHPQFKNDKDSDVIIPLSRPQSTINVDGFLKQFHELAEESDLSMKKRRDFEKKVISRAATSSATKPALKTLITCDGLDDDIYKVARAAYRAVKKGPETQVFFNDI